MSGTEDRWRYANALVNGFPQEAAKFIAEHSDPNQVRQRVEISRYERHDMALDERRNPFSTSPPWDSPHPPHAPSISPMHNRVSPFQSPDRYPPSPPSTTSAGRSNFQKPRLRNIIVYSYHHREEALSMREYSGSYHLIRADIVEDRLEFSTEECPNGPFVVGQTRISEQVTLTWRHNGSSDKTHKGVFYAVADLEPDVLLGTNEAGRPTNVTRGQTPDPQFAGAIVQPVPQRHGQQNLTFRQPDSYHSSSDYTARPASYSSQHRHVNVPSQASADRLGRSTPDRLRGPGLQMTASPIGGSIRSSSPASASGSANMGHPSRPGGQTPSNYSTASSTISQSSQASDVPRIEYTWDSVHRRGKVDLNGGGENFFLTLQQYFVLFNRTLERTHHVLFTAELETGETDTYALSLDESDLPDDFEAVVEWIKHLRLNHPLKLRAAIK